MEHPRHIALLHGGALGDLVLTLSLAGALRARFDPTHLTLISRVDLTGLCESVRDVDAFRSLEGMGMHTLFGESTEPDAVCLAALSRFDVIVSCLAEADATISRRLRTLLPGLVFSISTSPRDTYRDHITRQWRDDLAAAGLDLPRTPHPRITLPESMIHAGHDRLATVGKARIILHPGSGGEEKRWSTDHFKQLADVLNDRNIRACFLVGPVELDRHGEAFGSALSCHAPVLGDLSLPQAAACIAAADVYVGNDAGMSHLAAAIGTPVVAIFGPTDPVLWQPLGNNVTVLAGNPMTDAPFDGITVDMVSRSVIQLLTT